MVNQDSGFESNPMWVLLGKALSELPNTPTRELDAAVFSAIAEHANAKGRAFPSIRTIARRIGRSRMDVWRAVQRLIKLGWLTKVKEKAEGARFEHCVYMIAKRFLRKTVDKLAKHFDAVKWERWLNYAKTMGDYLKKYTVGAVESVEDRPVSKPALPVPDPLSSVPVKEETASTPVSSAEPVLQADTPIEWEDGSEWPTDPLDAPVMKQQTNLETLPTNTQPTNTANTQSVQTDMTNAPRFINGEVDARWETQQLLHELNPTMYPAY